MTMVARSDQVLDDHAKPVLGASVYVYDINGNAASLTSDGTSPLAQPLITDEFGNYSYQALEGYYREDTWYGAKLRYRENNIALGNPGADLALRSDLAASTGTALVKYQPAGTGAVSRTLQDKLRERVSVKDFGAAGDGVADDTTAIQAAISAVSTTGGEIIFPEGTYKITAAIQLNAVGIRLAGANKKNCAIVQATTTQPIINTTANYCEVSDLGLSYSGTAASGSTAAIIANGQYCNYRSLVISNPYNGINFTISPFQTASDIQILGYINAGFYLNAINDVFVSQFTCDAVNATNGAKGGIWLKDRVEAFSFTDGEVLNGVYPLTIEATLFTSGNRPAYGQLTNIFFDSAVQAASINNCVETGFTRCWFSNGRSGSGNPGCLVQQCDTVTFTNCEFFNCGSHGCNVTSAAKRLTFSNCSFESNSVTAGSGVAHGLTFAAATTDFVVSGGTAHNGLYTGVQGYGIAVTTGASDNYAIVGVNVNGNATGGILDGGTGTNKHILANPGCRTRNRGNGTIPSGSSSVTVAHGLAFTPTQADVIVSSNVNVAAAGVTNIWCSAVDATNITVTASTTATSNIGFTWDARKSA